MNRRRVSILMLAGSFALAAPAAWADVFNMPSGLTSLEMMPVDNRGNANDNTGFGGVAEPYLIGKYEVTNAQWQEFLTAKASVSDPHGLYNTEMAGIYGGIDRSGAGTAGDPYVYSVNGGDAAWDNRPVNWVSFWDAARFANWLHNGQADGDTESGAYVNIGNQSTFARQSGARYFIPTENEWYKAAYHQNDGVTGNYFHYPTATDSVPSNDLINPDPGNNANFWEGGCTIGSPYYTTEVGEFENSESPYGTFDQAGNIWEWTETATGSSRYLRGGDWSEISFIFAASNRYYISPGFEYFGYGFRVASIPEPGSITLLVCGAVAALIWWRRRMYSSRSA